MRIVVTFAGLSMLLSCVLVLANFIDASMKTEFGLELVVIFTAGALALISALVAFLRDLWLSLEALSLEMGNAREVK